MKSLIIAIAIFFTALLPSASCYTASIRAERLFNGPVICAGDVPGYSAIFNGDVHTTEDGALMGLFRMAREGYSKVSANNDRGYTLEDYFSDIGLFTSRDLGKSWEFQRIFVAGNDNLKSHIEHIKNSRQQLLTERVLESLESISQGSMTFNTLEDPRFIDVLDGCGKQRHYIFATEVPSDGKPYHMCALEVTFETDQHIEIINCSTFGPPENKDNWFLNIIPSSTQLKQIDHIKTMGISISDSGYPIVVATRICGEIQIIPFGAVDDIFSVTDHQWERILNEPKCFTTILKPDRVIYRSLGSNDQPISITPEIVLRAVLSHPEYSDMRWDLWKWFFYHTTKNSDRLEYETWAGIIDESANPIFLLPYSIQKPEEAFEIEGDIGYVVFNSGNIVIDGKIRHFNGVADTDVAVSETDEVALLEELLTN